jgi:type VI secretion system secreted protein VgrG
MAAITAAQPKIDAFNVAMYRAELPGMTTGMSDDALKLAGRSPEMTEQLEDLRDDGWQVVLGTPGGGSSCNKSAKIITMDPNNLTNAGDTIRTMAHEAGHAGYEKTTDLSSREAYLNGELGDEGQATLNNIEIQREILANGGPDIGISGNSANHAAYNAAFDEYEKTGDEAAARDAIAAIFGAGEVPSVKKPDGTPYADYNEYYGSWYDANVP